MRAQSLKFLRTTATLATAAALTVSLASCGLANNKDAKRDGQGKVSEQSEISAYKLRLGDCLQNPGKGNLEKITVVPCSQPHDLEVFAQSNYTGDAYPGDNAVTQKYEDFCSAQFKQLMGADLKTSVYSTVGLFPTQKSWNDYDDRQLLCLIGQVNPEATAKGVLTFKPITGSLVEAKK